MGLAFAGMSNAIVESVPAIHGNATGRPSSPTGPDNLRAGWSGQDTNPERLFAAGFGACAHSTLHVAARMQKIPLSNSSVGAQVHITIAED